MGAATKTTIRAADGGRIPVFGGWLTRSNAARVLGICPHTLALWTRKGIGPPHAMEGRHCLYEADGLLAFQRTRRARAA